MDGQYALDQIITKAFHENKVDLGKLQVEENSRNVASLQGHIAGYKELVRIISEEFVVSPGWIGTAEINSDRDVVLPDLSDEALAELFADAKNMIENSPAWGKVLSRITDKTAELKDDLFFKGHSTRDIDISQGHYYGMTIYESFFKAIDNEVELREKAKKDKEEELPFDGDGLAGEPGVPSAQLKDTRHAGQLSIEAPDIQSVPGFDIETES